MLEFQTREPDLGQDFAQARSQVESLVQAMSPRHDLRRIDRAFVLVEGAYDGRLAGYQKLQTLYHNHQHTLEVALCAVRLLHGMHLSERTLTDDAIDMAIVGALLHDVGYLKRDIEGDGTGAQFTADHVRRGAEFARAQLSDEPAPFVDGLANVVLVTDHRLAVDRLSFATEDERLAALATGTADLVSQMANREYLERLVLLYLEFKEAGLGGFAGFDDLLEKTAAFYRVTRERLDGPLGGLGRYLARHFEQAEGAACDRYQESIDKNLAYLERILQLDHGRRIDMLKRGGIVARVRKQFDA